ncbi:unnamed protein product [Dibothriocephalus latus]|uniref:R3H domain-containing protein n=1 Tax=Dibothriocephalus latus TaxID=60516 RepID=A0A3P7N2N1_DIBLA|nr:unnamed protein product [Dibothriocephalus latus]
MIQLNSPSLYHAAAEHTVDLFKVDSRTVAWGALVPLKEGETPTTKCPSHRFPPMNKYKRRFIKELAEFYGVETVAFDPEPHRHLLAMTTLATACYPGGSRQHHVKLSSQVQKQFTGSVKITGVESGVSNRVASVRSSVEVASASNNQVIKPVSFSLASASSSSANAFEDS